MKIEEEKRRAREQWSQDPCGAKHGAKYEFATREFFDEVERHRYSEYAPWMPEVMGFDKFAGKRLLEIGCGAGRYTRAFLGYRPDLDVYGCDISHIALAEAEAADKRGKIHYRLGDALALPYEDNRHGIQ